MSYSQRQEEEIIKKFFQSPGGNLKIDNLLSIGENDGETLSNTRALILAGWSGWLIEPDETAYKKLAQLYHDNDRVRLFNMAIGDRSRVQKFWSSGTHLNKGDTGLLSTLDENEMLKWKRAGTPFTETQTYVTTWGDFYESISIRDTKFQLFSIDAEGYDLKILKQIDFNQTETKMVVVEFNGVDRHLYDQIMYKFNFNLIHISPENLIYAR